jgi:diphthamide biosynthesis methyltransferase
MANAIAAVCFEFATAVHAVGCGLSCYHLHREICLQVGRSQITATHPSAKFDVNCQRIVHTLIVVQSSREILGAVSKMPVSIVD